MKSKTIVWISVIIILLLVFGQPKGLIGQGAIKGVVTNAHTMLPQPNTTVILSATETYVAETNDIGYYEILANAGQYELQFILVGYDTIIQDVQITEGGLLEVNTTIYKYPYPVRNLWATILQDGTSEITWDPPYGPYEIVHDDGQEDDFTIWSHPGGCVAVKYTPGGYPSTIIGGRIYVGDGSFPVGGNFLDTQMAIGIVDDDGVGGLPGTNLDSLIVTVDNFDWVEFYDVTSVEINEGDFYICMWQLGDSLNSAPVGVDTNPPYSNQSYTKPSGSNTWNLSVGHDLMIRTYIDGPNYPSSLQGYVVARVSNFDPCMSPVSGTLTPISNPSGNSFVDNGFGGQSPGYYAWAVRASYEFGSSDWAYSNSLLTGNKTVNFEISLCNGSNFDSALITMSNLDTCVFTQYQMHTNDQGFASLNRVAYGYYNIQIDAQNLPPYIIPNVLISVDTTLYIEYSSDNFPPQNLIIDTITNIASWDPPVMTLLNMEKFENELFPPVGWSAYSMCDIGWHQQDDDLAYPFYIPSGDGAYAVSDNVESNSNGCNNNLDYLIAPLVSLIENHSYFLQFDYYYDQKNDESAYVIYQHENSSQIEVLETLSSSVGWETKIIDISGFVNSGSKILSFGFHHTDNSWYIPTGLAIDNIQIIGDEPEIYGYQISLYDVIIDTLPPEQTQYYFNDLIDGQTYEFCVKAIYECGVSEAICEVWEYIEIPTYYLPYFEGWDDRLYTLNNWTVSGTDYNWQINNEIGSPFPSLQFKGDSVTPIEFSSAITSPLIIAENILVGNIFFEFDIKQDLVENTGLDTLLIEISDGSDWHTIYESTSNFDFDFTPQKFDISDIALGNYIVLRISVNGVNSNNIEGWYIDNIHVYRECLSPELLTGEENWVDYSKSAVKITWEMPGNPESISEWIYWDDGENFSGIAGDEKIFAAVRWDSGQLQNYESAFITKMRIFPYEEFTFCELRIWSGQNAEELIYSHEVTELTVPGEWNEFILEEPVLIDNSKELWVGYAFDMNYGTYPAGVDKGPAIENYGNMVSYDEHYWFRLSDYGLSGNWNIQAFIVEDEYVTKERKLGMNSNRNMHRSLSGFNVYRKQNEAEFGLYDFVDYVIGQENYVYYDTTPNVNLQNGYSYKVTATWQSNLDYCESIPAMSMLNPEEDFVYVFLEDIPDNTSKSSLKIFPNPARDYVAIEAVSPIISVRILNLNGQTIIVSNQADEMIVVVNTENLKRGVYLVEVETDTETLSNKLVIAR